MLSFQKLCCVLLSTSNTFKVVVSYFFFFCHFFIYCNDYGVVVRIINVTPSYRARIAFVRFHLHVDNDMFSVRKENAKFMKKMNVIWHRHWVNFSLADSYSPCHCWLLGFFPLDCRVYLPFTVVAAVIVVSSVCMLNVCLYIYEHWIHKSITSAIHVPICYFIWNSRLSNGNCTLNSLLSLRPKFITQSATCKIQKEKLSQFKLN